MNNSEYIGLDEEQIGALEWQTYCELKEVYNVKEAARFLRLARTISPEKKHSEIQDLLSIKRNTNDKTRQVLETDTGIQDSTIELLEERLLCTSVMHQKPLAELNGEEKRYLEIIQELEAIRKRNVRIRNTRSILSAFN